MKKKTIKTLMLGLLLSATISLNACGVNNDQPPSSGSHNEIASTVETQNSIQGATTALASSITDEQKSTTLPATYQTGTNKITGAGNYYFSGTLLKKITIKENAGDVHIWLDNVTFSVEDSAIIKSDEGAYVTITLIGNSSLENSMSDISNEDLEKHVINSAENLVINGNGSLSISSTKSGIKCDKTFIGLGGTIKISAPKHGITADTIYIDGLTVNAIYCGKDILHAESDYDEVDTAPEFSFENGFVYIVSGAISSSEVLGDCIQADSFVYISGGTFCLTTTPTWQTYTASQNGEKGMFSKSGNTYSKVSADAVRRGNTYYTLKESVKGIKVGEIDYTLSSNPDTELVVTSDDYAILIDGGTFEINTTDDGIHANSGSILISGGTFEISTSDDGIHADNSLKISNDADINVLTSYEGIEAETIEISGGTTKINALDDGVNSANGNLSENEQKNVCQINITGGRLDVTVNPNGDRDGIDSNGGIKITGGIVITRGPNNANACPLDASNAITITGGTTIIIGYNSGSNGGSSWNSGRHPMGMSEGVFSTTLQKTQSSSKGLTLGEHSVNVAGTTISYYNSYKYSGYTTVYSSETATIN